MFSDAHGSKVWLHLFSFCLLPFLSPKEKNSVLWNAMIHPLLNMTIYGAIWYQGSIAIKDSACSV